jgi:hypothetical protein
MPLERGIACARVGAFGVRMSRNVVLITALIKIGMGDLKYKTPSKTWHRNA